MKSAHIREKIRLLPKEPGCYLMKDEVGRIIYVGKAKNLKARVSQYFAGQLESQKTRVLVDHIADFELIITQNEIEALLLERTLIKHHKPRFNVLLRDDKEYPFLRINFQEDWPRIEKVRRRKEDGAVYLGPFSNSGQLRILVDAALRIFPLVRCSRHEFAHARRPCNYYHMKMCLGPCKIPVPKDQYKATVQDAVHFLSGKNSEVIERLKLKMKQASEAENFELAVLYRDQLKAFAAVTEKQNVVTTDIPNADVIGLDQTALKTAFHVLTIRNFQLVGQDSFVLKSEIASREEALSQFLLQYYETRSLPQDLLLPFAFEDSDTLRLALMKSHPDSKTFCIHTPMRGGKKDLVEMAQKNAAYKLTELEFQSENTRTELLLLQEKLRLTHFPHRMECIDISNTQGTAIVASNVCFIDGKAAKEYYRHYNVTTVESGPDDFKSIAEVVERRLARALRDGDMPQLLIIDGGRGQLSSAWQAFQSFYAGLDANLVASLPKCDLISLAKAKSHTPRGGRAQHGPERAFERVFLLGNDAPILLSPGTPEYRILTQIRDEAHRFAITHHRKTRSQISLSSPLIEIPGIGKKLQQNLMSHFGSILDMKKASLEELLKFKGLRQSSAVALNSFLQSMDESPSPPPVHSSADNDLTFELTIRIVDHQKIVQKKLRLFLETNGFHDYVDAMLDGIIDQLPDDAQDEEQLWNHFERSLLPLCIYRQRKEDLEKLVDLLRQEYGDALSTTLTPLTNESWQNAWQASLDIISTPRFDVRPVSPHDEEDLMSPPKPTIRVILSHQQNADVHHEVFGDGRHGTTEVCLQILGDLPQPDALEHAVLDVGTGSGILAIAMGLLGYQHVVFTDLDHEIIRIAKRHIELNSSLFHEKKAPHWHAHITDQIPLPPIGLTYDLITANILAPVLHQLLPSMEAHLSVGGHLILAGFIEKEAAPLIEKALQKGLTLLKQCSCRGWIGLLFVKKPV